MVGKPDAFTLCHDSSFLFLYRQLSKSQKNAQKHAKKMKLLFGASNFFYYYYCRTFLASLHINLSIYGNSSGLKVG